MLGFVTILFIVVATLIATFVRRVKRDKCLRDFAGYIISLKQRNAKIIFGRLRVENTGIELHYQSTHKDEQGHIEKSYILYKNEYAEIQSLLRFHNQLTDQSKKKRHKDLEKIYHPNIFRRTKRKFLNIFKTLRDSVAEVVNLLIARAKMAGGMGTTLASQDKYVNQMKQELMGSVGTSYEPLLERYIGHKVVLEVAEGDKAVEYSGILKDYSADFIEVMDVDYKNGETMEKADMVVPRQYGIVRHLGE